MLLCAGAPAVHAATTGEGGEPLVATITVTGTAEVQLTPDRATMIIAIRSQALTGAEAGADNARVTQAVTQALRDAGVPAAGLSTVGYSVEPQWQYRPGTAPRLTGYAASTSLRLSVASLKLLGRWIDTALGAGASEVNDIEFESSAAAGARRQALALAVEDAQSDAQSVARAAGGRLGALQNINVQPEFNVPRRPQPVVMAAALRTAAATQILPMPLTVRAVVQARWSFVNGP